MEGTLVSSVMIMLVKYSHLSLTEKAHGVSMPAIPSNSNNQSELTGNGSDNSWSSLDGFVQ